jgi:hypothetical protein
MIKEFLGIILFLAFFAFIMNPTDSAAKLGDIIHAFKYNIERGLQ